MSDRLIFALGMMVTMMFVFGATLMVRDVRRSDQENKRRAARRALYAKPRVVDIDPKEEQLGASHHEWQFPANNLTGSKTDS